MRLQKADFEGYWMQEADTSAASLSEDDAVDENVPPKMSQEETLRELEWLRREQQLLQRVAINRKRKSDIAQ